MSLSHLGDIILAFGIGGLIFGILGIRVGQGRFK